MRYIESKSRDPYYNLALEEYVFDYLPKDDSYFMLWQNANTIVIGKYQNTVEEINQSYVDEHKINVARRLSGGGAVYHDDGNLNYTFIVDDKDIEDLNFEIFVVPVIETLKSFGIKAEFTGRNDITIDGKKFSGNSQYIKKGRVMHHGCMMLDSNLEDVSQALNVKAAKFTSKNSKSVRSRVTTINANLEKKITMEEYKNALKKNIFGNDKVEEYLLTEEDERIVKKIRDEKYATWEWVYGRSLECTIEREEKFPAGLVTIHMTEENGVIKEIHFSGDFFGNGEIEELEKEFTGLKLDENLEKEIDEMNINHYMHGISAKELAGLIRA